MNIAWYPPKYKIVFIICIRIHTFKNTYIAKYGNLALNISSINQSINQSVNQSVSQSVNQSVNQSVSQSVSQSVNQGLPPLTPRVSEDGELSELTLSTNTQINTHEDVFPSENEYAYLLDTNSGFITENDLDEIDSTEKQDLESYQRQSFDSYIQGLNKHIPIYLSRVIYYSPAELLSYYPLDLTVTCEETLLRRKEINSTLKTTENSPFLLETKKGERHTTDML